MTKDQKSPHPEANFLQTPAWAKANEALGHTALLKDFGGGDRALMLIKNAKRGRYLEIPGGPLLNWDEPSKVATAFSQIQALAKEHRCVFVRFRPQLENTPENLAKMAKIGARPAPFHLHAEHTVIIDLKKSEADLLADLRRQTRYEVRKAERLGLKVKKGHSAELFDQFYEVQQQTAARQHFIPPSKKALHAYRTAFGADAEIYTVSEKEAGLITMGLFLKSGAEVDYFEGASTPLGRKYPGAYLMLWQAIKDAKQQGYQRLNLWGIAPEGAKNHRYSGVTTFKKGFGGAVVEYLPAHDIIINKVKYAPAYLLETLRKKRRHLS